MSSWLASGEGGGTDNVRRSHTSSSKFRPSDQMTDEQFRKTWDILKSAIDQVHSLNAGSLSYEELYRYGYNLVVAKFGDRLYENVTESLVEHLQNEATKILLVPDSQLLAAVAATWVNYRTTLKMISDIFMYLDRSFCAAKGYTPIFLLGIELFRQKVLESPDLAVRLINRILEDILLHRLNQKMDHSLIKQLTSMISQVDPQIKYYQTQRSTYLQDRNDIKAHGDFYRTYFEAPFLAETTEFYHFESNEAIQRFSVFEFLTKAEQRFKEEAVRAQLFLDPTTYAPLHERLVVEWVLPHASSLIQNKTEGCQVMFREGKMQELQKLYDLLNRAPETLNEIRTSMESYITQAANNIILDEANQNAPVQLIEDLLNLRRNFTQLVHNSFREDPDFKRTLRSAFEIAINRDSRVAKSIAIAIDDLLRRYRGSGNGKQETAVECRMDEDESKDCYAYSRLEAKVESIIELFRFIEDKDIFESFYRDYLAKRLLSLRGTSEETELLILSYLKLECGHAYTLKLEGMLRDIARSKDMDNEFHRSQFADSNAALNFTVSVLTSGHWPTEPSTQLSLELTPVLSALCNAYQTFYLGRHTGRKLTWLTSLGTGELRGYFATCKRDLVLGTGQILILLLFNESYKISYKEIIQQLNPSNKDDLKRCLASLYANPKLKILLRYSCKASPEKNVKDNHSDKETILSPLDIALTDYFEVNPQFHTRMMRVRVPALTIKCKSYLSGHDGGTGAEFNESSLGNAGSSSKPGSIEIDGAIPGAVEEERRLLTDAAIVRVMKSHKQLKHNDLIIEVTRLLQPRFSPKPSMIKARIGNLIERDFLERCSSDVQMYSYVA